MIRQSEGPACSSQASSLTIESCERAHSFLTATGNSDALSELCPRLDANGGYWVAQDLFNVARTKKTRPQSPGFS